MDRIATENYYFAQAFLDSPTEYGCIRFVVFAPKHNEALELAKKYLEKVEFKAKEVMLYHKNYKRESRGLVAEGKFIE
jgi:hypothetical protein